MGEDRNNEIKDNPNPLSGAKTDSTGSPDKGSGVVRSRFAPSPTGRMHIGGVRSALYAYLTAKSKNGKFILRIEDTDQVRFVEGATQEIYQTLKIVGINWDEGPFMQSERKNIHLKHAQKLLDDGKAYKCFCTSERLDELRKEQVARKLPPKYDRKCVNLTTEEVKAKEDAGEKFVIRMKIPTEGFTEFKDMIKKKVRIKNSELDDQVLVKSDGFPTYHLANVVDDHEMKITHVVRGEEWLPSTPKHILLYLSLGWKPPRFAHVPMVVNKQKKKLSKRDGDTAFMDFIAKGYLPEALLNFLVLQGWNPKTEQEFFTLEELIKIFDITSVHKSPAVFDYNKLDWFNGHYIRKMSIDELTEKCKPYLEKKYDLSELTDEQLQAIIALEQERMKKLSDVTEYVEFFFGEPELDKEKLVWKKASAEETKNALEKGIEVMTNFQLAMFKREKLEEALKALCEKESIPPGTMFWAMRYALTGKERSPGVFEVAEVLGKKKAIARLEKAITKL